MSTRSRQIALAREAWEQGGGVEEVGGICDACVVM